MDVMLMVLVLFTLYVIDFAITVVSVSWYKRKYPNDEDWEGNEANPIVRYLWRRLGFVKGTVVAFFAVIPIILLPMYLLDDRVFFYMLGAYTLVYHNHFQNVLFMYTRKKRKEI